LTVAVTGASGFVGSALVTRLAQSEAILRVCVRSKSAAHSETVQPVVVGSLAADTDWHHAMRGVNVVLHLAARAHVMRETARDPLAEFRRVNVEGALNLARQAAAAGVKRFVFVSSVKVNGESTLPGCPFVADALPAPQDIYGLSKHEAEVGLRQIAAQTDMEVVVVRPPLVYGPGAVKGNFAAMMRWLQRGLPLPLGAVTHNRRSLVALDNLVDLLAVCVDHPAAGNQTLLVSDDEDLSTTGLLTRMGQAMGRSARLFAVPPALLQQGARLLGQGGVAQRLLDSLQVDISKTRNLLDWTPPIGVDEGLRRAAAPFLRKDASC